jgi:hypothetical protein
VAVWCGVHAIVQALHIVLAWATASFGSSLDQDRRREEGLRAHVHSPVNINRVWCTRVCEPVYCHTLKTRPYGCAKLAHVADGFQRAGRVPNTCTLAQE